MYNIYIIYIYIYIIYIYITLCIDFINIQYHPNRCHDTVDWVTVVFTWWDRNSKHCLAPSPAG